MKKNNKITSKDITNLLRMAYVSHRLNIYGKGLKLNQSDIDCLRNIFTGYTLLIERCQNEITK